MWRLILLLLAGVKASALIFPLLPGENGAYEANFNVLRSYNAVWATNHHAIINVGSLNGVAVAPRWFLTAWHVAAQLNTNSWANDDGQRYDCRGKVNLGNDLALVEVNRPFPFYSQIQKRPADTDDIVMVYGQSGVPEEPIYDATGEPRGWRFGRVGFKAALRWGQGRLLPVPSIALRWNFTRDDLRIGHGGLNCATVTTNDSGGGIFAGDQLIGVIARLETEGFRTLLDEPSTPDCEPIGHLFDASQFYSCASAKRHPVTRSYGTPVYPALSNIFARISPPRYLNAGGGSVSANGQVWENAPACSGCSAYVDSSPDPIDTTGWSAPAPQEVYRSADYLHAQPGGALTFTLSELIKYEKYSVRLHFASIFPADAPGVCTERIVVNGVERVVDPYSGVRKANLVTFGDVSPDENSEINVAITPQNAGGNAMISGIEVVMTPLPSQALQELKWDLVFSFPNKISPQQVFFGNGVFLSAGFQGPPLISTDNGGTWQPINESPEIFGAGQFVGFPTVNTNIAIISSADGLNWTGHKLDSEAKFNSLAFGNGKFVALGFESTNLVAAVSEDLDHWQFSPGPPIDGYYDVTFANDRFFIRQNNYTTFASSDGHTWTRVPLIFPEPDPECTTDCPRWWLFNKVTFGNGLYVTYGLASVKPPIFWYWWQNRGGLLQSRDGEHWEAGVSIPYVTDRLFFANGEFVYAPALMATPDLVNWHSFELPLYPNESATNLPVSIDALSYGNGNYVVLGRGEPGTAKPTLFARGTSLDSLERIDHPPGSGSRPRVAGVGRTVVVANPYPGLPVPLIVSTNSGASLTPIDLPPESRGLLGVVYGHDQFIGFGEQGKVLRSPDGLKWMFSSSGTTNDLVAATFAQNLWVVVGNNGTIIVSTDGVSFSPVSSGTTVSLSGVAFGAGGFVAVGPGGTILRSADGQQWLRERGGDFDLAGVAFGNGTYTAVGAGGYVENSPDAVHWTTTHPGIQDYRDITFADGYFAALGTAPGLVHISTDGATWLTFGIRNGTVCVQGTEEEIWFGGIGFAGKLRLHKPEVRLSGALDERKNLSLSFDAPTGGLYTILSSSDAVAGPWEPEATVTRDRTDVITWIRTNAVDHAQFYRVQQQ